MTIGFLKKASETILKSKSILSLIEPELGGVEKARPYTSIRASMLTGEVEFCPREVALLDILKRKPKDKYIPAALRVCFDQGDALHDMARNKWMRDFVVGDWECEFCGHTVHFNKRPKQCCPDCKKANWRYKEVGVSSSKCGASGSLDMLLDFGVGKHTIVEVKTMGKDEFKTLVAPVAEHRVRTNLYLELTKDSENPVTEFIDTTHAKIFYISKGFGMKNTDTNTVLPFKEFDVFYDAESAKPYTEKAKTVMLFRKGEIGIPSGVCKTSFTQRAKQCSACKECFSGDFPQGKMVELEAHDAG